MKNINLKLNKTKLVARLMLAVIWVMSIVVLSSCYYYEPNLKKGQHYSSGNPELGNDIMVVIEQTQIDLDDFYVDAYIGLHLKKHPLSEWISTDKEALLRETVDISRIPDFNENLCYIVSIANENAFSNNFNHLDLNKAYILKEISSAESYENGNYNYTKIPFGSGYYYNYCERFVIPKNFILDTLDTGHGTWIFCLSIVEKDPVTGECIGISNFTKASFDFIKTEDGRIMIGGRIFKYE